MRSNYCTSQSLPLGPRTNDIVGGYVYNYKIITKQVRGARFVRQYRWIGLVEAEPAALPSAFSYHPTAIMVGLVKNHDTQCTTPHLPLLLHHGLGHSSHCRRPLLRHFRG